jgi:hypothetical protein
MRLTEKQERFSLLYAEHGSATEAYGQAYKAERMKDKTIYCTTS